MTAGAGEAVGEGRAARRAVSRQRDLRIGIPDLQVCSPPVPTTPDSADFLSSRRHPGFPFPSSLPLVWFSGPTTPRLRTEAKAKQTRPPREGNSSRGTGAEHSGVVHSGCGAPPNARSVTSPPRVPEPVVQAISRAAFLDPFRERPPSPCPKWPSRRPPSA